MGRVPHLRVAGDCMLRCREGADISGWASHNTLVDAGLAPHVRRGRSVWDARRGHGDVCLPARRTGLARAGPVPLTRPRFSALPQHIRRCGLAPHVHHEKAGVERAPRLRVARGLHAPLQKGRRTERESRDTPHVHHEKAGVERAPCLRVRRRTEGLLPRMAATKNPGRFPVRGFRSNRSAAYFDAASSSFSSCGAGATSCMIQRM